jgi:hypothetical protein
MKELLAAGGSAFLIPAVLFGLILYATRGLFGLHGRRSQQRKEFLELWTGAQDKDDLWLEVAIRHLFGTYMPAHVIRLALAQSDKNQALRDLSELWPLLRFDETTNTANWRNRTNRSRSYRKFKRYALLSGYFLLLLAAATMALIASYLPVGSLASWAYWINAILLLVVAFICLEKAETAAVAERAGDHGWRASTELVLLKPRHLLKPQERHVPKMHSDPCSTLTPILLWIEPTGASA